MTQWPRTITSRLTTPPAMPTGLETWGQSGKGQFRSFTNMGRIWEEVYASFRMTTAEGRELVMAINRALREKIVWDIQHPYWRTNYGVGAGPIDAPTAPTPFAFGLVGPFPLGNGTYKYRVTFVTADGETEGGTVAQIVNANHHIGLSGIPAGGSSVTERKIYRTAVNGSTFKLAATIADNVTTTLAEDTVHDIDLGATCPVANTTGSSSGFPAIDGAGQTGAVLLIQGCPSSTVDFLKAGDIIKVDGLQQVLDVTADVDTESDGSASIPIHPPIFAGGSPADLAFIETDAAAIYFQAVLVSAQMPEIEADGVVAAGLTLVWREQPSA